MNINKKNVFIKVGDKPGWKKPVLNAHYENGSVKSAPISSQAADLLIESGMSVEG